MFDYNSGCFFLTNFGDFLLTRNGYNRLTLTNFPKIHPIQHLDLYYNNRGTLKIGLHKEYNTENLINLTNHNTECKFLEND